MSVASGTLETPLGTLVVTWTGVRLEGLELALPRARLQTRKLNPGPVQILQPDKPLGEGARVDSPVPPWVRQALDEYFRDGMRGLDLPVAPAGTDFQRRVWAMLRTIPPGFTRTYGDLARELGTSPRAVGGACRANPCLIAVPCHRVVARDGLGGFGGERGGKRLAVKRWLLRHEGAAAGRLP